MKNVGKIFLWLTLLNKRLLMKISFLVILCCIPFLVVGVNYMTKQDSGMLKVVIHLEDTEDELATEVIKELKNHENMLQFMETSSVEEAQKLVQNGKADMAWLFPANLQSEIEAFLNNDANEEGIIQIIEKEDNVALHLSREILFGRLYKAVSYTLYTQFVTQELLPGETISEEMLSEHYARTNMDGNMFEFSFLDGEKGDMNTSYLLFPMRGLLAVVIALCGLALGLYFMQDEQKGIFTWMPLNKSVWGSWLYQLPGLLDVGIIVMIALKLAGIFTNWQTELILMVLYLLMVAGFSDVVRRLCGKPVRLGAIIPMLMLIMLALSPIFMGAVNAKPIQVFLPSYYYLNAIHNKSYWLWMLVYIVIVYVTDFLLLKLETVKRIK